MIEFLARRVTIAAVFSACAAFLIWDRSGLIAVGVLLGAFFSIMKTALFGKTLELAFVKGRPFGVLFYVFAQAAAFVLMLVSILADARLFAGTAGGLLLLPAVICLNGITEKIGLTHNGWSGGRRANG